MDRQPLYSRIADRLEADITSGRYRVGTVLPKEPDLALQLQVSRSTVRAALAALESRKLVSRRKNAGTRVESDKPQNGYGTSLATLPDLVQWAQQCERVVQHAGPVVMDAALARELGCAPDSHWLLVQSLRFDATRSEPPVSWTDAYIDVGHAGVLALIEQQPSVLMSELLEQHFRIELAVVEQEVTGWKISKGHAAALGVKVGEPALKVVRRYLTRDRQLALLTRSVHPAKRFSIKTTLTRT